LPYASGSNSLWWSLGASADNISIRKTVRRARFSTPAASTACVLVPARMPATCLSIDSTIPAAWMPAVYSSVVFLGSLPNLSRVPAEFTPAALTPNTTCFGPAFRSVIFSNRMTDLKFPHPNGFRRANSGLRRSADSHNGVSSPQHEKRSQTLKSPP
jgi:hypothetical protein